MKKSKSWTAEVETDEMVILEFLALMTKSNTDYEVKKLTI